MSQNQRYHDYSSFCITLYDGILCYTDVDEIFVESLYNLKNPVLLSVLLHLEPSRISITFLDTEICMLEKRENHDFRHFTQ